MKSSALLFCLLASLLSVAPAQARPVHRGVKAPKTHRLIAGDKRIRVNNAGEVITDRHP